ncbi:unnamed protein product [Microthlaspi erraticum]|uniref:RBR-type E3 ubiquitin transferase n=1 Tax=Microthlaspi erraticum TaxID=1685480 RepID=A0A6D2IJ42_9BRAS|nr:unnamed protein product [Microthlaspi erraticum]
MATKTLAPHSLESLIGSETFRLYCKGLVSEEVIKDDDKQIGDVPSDDKFEVQGCLHRFCVECIRKHVQTTLKRWKPADCPASGCNSELEAEDCEGFLGPDELATMTKRKRESMIKFSERVYCRECNTLMAKQSLLEYTSSFFDGAELSGARKCMECHIWFCINCGTGWHCNMTCDEYQKTESYKTSFKAMYLSHAESEGWQRCRECNDMIQLVDGCKHITCRICKFEFCYTCGAEWRNKKATCDCPLWD